MEARSKLSISSRLFCLPLLAALCAACINPGAEGSTTWGDAVFHVLDQQDAPVRGVTLSIEYDTNWSPHVVVTDSAGVAESAGPAGTWLLTMKPPDGFAIPAGGVNPVLIRIRRGRTIEYVLRLDRKIRLAGPL